MHLTEKVLRWLQFPLEVSCTFETNSLSVKPDLKRDAQEVTFLKPEDPLFI